MNDADDMEAVLQVLGFSVDKVLNGSLEQMESAVIRLKNKLSVSRDSYGFLFYAGHGVQSNNENYLIPVDANIQSENFLRQRAVSVQTMLDELNDAGNELNIVVLDACRDNPFGWARSGSRGLTLVRNQPADSIVVYATAAGSTAADGTGRNGLFTTHLLNNLKTPGLEMSEVFRRTGADVSRASNNQQRPVIYSQFFGTAYLGSRPAAVSSPAPTPQPTTLQAVIATSSISVTSGIAGEILLDGTATGIRIREGGTVTMTNVSTGNTEVAVREDNGQISKALQTVMVRQGQTVAAVIERPASANMIRINGGTFQMGSPANEPGRSYSETQHQVTVSSFYMGKYPVTQAEYEALMGTNPSNFKGPNLPVEIANWYDVIEYCNHLSQREGLAPAYTVNGTNVTWNRGASGYRLPTEAEWEYACRAGTTTPFSTGNNITTSQANYDGNYPYYNNAKGTYRQSTTAVGSFSPNPWGLYDMHGNVWEWCWDWYGTYSNEAQTDPVGAASGSIHVIRGGCWYGAAQYARSASRSNYDPSIWYGSIGFRLVRN